MKVLEIEGNKPLSGTINIGGAKNSAVALIPAALLSDEDVVIEAMQTALSTAFRKNERADYASRVLIDRNTGEIKVFKVTTIVDDYNDDDYYRYNRL